MSRQADSARIDAILADWKTVIGADWPGYRNHVVRMATFCLLLRDCDAEEQEKIEIAACFHDIGLWTDQTLDYLAPSVPRATGYLEAHSRSGWSQEITQMILQHHKVRVVEDGISPLVELFRKGDLVDVSLGLVRFGLSKTQVNEVRTRFPNAGFHGMLLKRAGRWFVRHPLNPAPMMKW